MYFKKNISQKVLYIFQENYSKNSKFVLKIIFSNIC